MDESEGASIKDRISVLIPVFEAERFLAEALASVEAQILPACEVIVVDDGSSDGTRRVAASFADRLPLRCLAQAHSGAAAARNTAARASRGDLLTFLDADDLWTSAKLRLQANAFREHGPRSMIFAHVDEFLDVGAQRALPRLLPGCLPGTLLVSRDTFFEVGEFDVRWRVGEFVDWYARAVGTGLVPVMLKEVLLRRRIHADNLVTRERESVGDYAQILKRALDRKRKSP